MLHLFPLNRPADKTSPYIYTHTSLIFTKLDDDILAHTMRFCEDVSVRDLIH